MLPSQMPSHTTSPCSARAYATASAAERISGSDTISSQGVPARFRSIPVEDSPCGPVKSSCRDLPASSSRCARVRLTVFSWSPTKKLMVPPCTTGRSEEHTSELQSLMRISYAVFCLKKKQQDNQYTNNDYINNT